MRKISFEAARASYPYRYTCEHIPAHALRACGNGLFLAPQYASDREWYDSTTFPGEGELHGNSAHCESGAPTWPHGRWLARAGRLGSFRPATAETVRRIVERQCSEAAALATTFGLSLDYAVRS